LMRTTNHRQFQARMTVLRETQVQF
jgi:hypothetical protein